MAVRMRNVTAILAFLACAAGVGAETVVSGLFGLSSMMYLSGTNGSILDDTRDAPGIVGSSQLGMQLSTWGEIYSLDAELEAVSTTPTGALVLKFPRAILDLTPSDRLTFRLGRFTYIPGNAEFRSPLSYLSPRDTQALFSGDFDSLQAPSELLQATAYLGRAYLRLTAVPIRPRPILPETDSIWFPRNTIPEAVERDGDVYLLRSLYYAVEGDTPDRVIDASFLGEIAASVGPVDGSLLGFTGYSNQLILRPRVDAQLVSRTFDVALDPVQNRVDGIGVALAGSIGPARLYLEGSHTRGRISVMNLAAWQERTSLFTRNDPAPIYTSGVQELLVGGSYQGYIELAALGGVQWVALAEYFTTVGVPSAADPGLLAEFAGISATATTYRPDLSIGLYSVVSWKEPDYGLATVVSVVWQATPEVGVTLHHPLFLGSSDNELGQYEDLHILRAEVTVRF